MLVKLTDTKGRAHWINPVYVRALREKGGVTEVCIQIPGMLGNGLRVPQPMDEVAMAINVAMPDVGGYPPDESVEESQQAAASAAAMGG